MQNSSQYLDPTLLLGWTNVHHHLKVVIPASAYDYFVVCQCSSIAKVPDEEGGQTRAWGYLFDIRGAGLNGVNEVEQSHPKYNAFKRALRESKLEGAHVKASVICNNVHQPFMSLTNLRNLREALKVKLCLG